MSNQQHSLAGRIISGAIVAALFGLISFLIVLVLSGLLGQPSVVVALVAALTVGPLAAVVVTMRR